MLSEVLGNISKKRLITIYTSHATNWLQLVGKVTFSARTHMHTYMYLYIYIYLVSRSNWVSRVGKAPTRIQERSEFESHQGWGGGGGGVKGGDLDLPFLLNIYIYLVG